MTRAKPLPFEQQPGESARAFAAFSCYLNMGAERSLADAARKLGKSTMVLGRWSRRWGWVDRVAAYGVHLAAIEREVTEASVRNKAAEWLNRDEELRDRNWKTGERAWRLAEEAIERWIANPERCGGLEGIAKLLDLASILGHRATGTPYERVAVTGADGGPVRLEFEAAVQRVYGGHTVEAEVVAETPALPAATPAGAPTGGPAK